MTEQLLRHLPKIDALTAQKPLVDWPVSTATLLARQAVAEVRKRILAGEVADADAVVAAVAAAVAQRAQVLQQPSLRPVWNGAGILLHTNAGRAPLGAAAAQQLQSVAAGYCNLELSLDTGKRSNRQDHVRPLLCWLTGAQDALVVNNGAAAILLAVHALAAHRPVLVSRGELIEIGGSFRMPDVLVAAGAELVEVGTTNRTHLRDYEQALVRLQEAGRPAAAIVVVHRSNFAILGFEAHPELTDLKQLASKWQIPLVVDLGSGALAPIAATLVRPPDGSAPRREPTVREVLDAGADVVTFSGDKLIGGPQAGILCGHTQWVARLAASAMARALRVDNLCLAALEATARSHLLGQADRDLPVLAQLQQSAAEVQAAAQELAHVCSQAMTAAHTALFVALVPVQTRLGGGTDPLVVLESWALAISTGDGGPSATALADAALQLAVPVLGRVRGQEWLLDTRTLLAGAGGRSIAEVGEQLAVALGQAWVAAGGRR
jgi:L-seryl-tRNA(Ser) seleniumtransferase